MKIAGFLDNSRTDMYAGTSDFFFWRENISEGNRFGGESFGVELFGVANTCYFVMNNVVATNHLPNVVMNIISALG